MLNDMYLELITSYLPRRTIYSLLCCSGCMNCGHESFNYFKVIVDDFSERCQAVGCARGIRDHFQ